MLPSAEIVVEGGARILVQVASLLVVARLLGTLATRLGVTRVIGELATGFVLGPSLFGRLLPDCYDLVFSGVASATVSDLSVVGLVFLLTLAGMETDVGLVRTYVRDVVAIGSLGLALPFALGVVLGLAIPAALLTETAPRVVFALFLATALSISALPVVVRILIDLDAFTQPFGQLTVAIAMYTDVVGWLLLSVVVGMARIGTLDAGAVGGVLLALVAFVGGAVIVGRRLLETILARLDEDDVRGQVTVVVGAALVGGAITHELGLEPSLGAFVAGLLLSRAGGIAERTTDTFERVTLGAFAPLFFGVAGLDADLSLLFDPTVARVGTITLVIATIGKLGGVTLAASLLGYSRREALGMGVGLNARGAIEIVVATVGLELGILSVRMYTVVLGVAVVTSAMTPPLLRRVLRPLTDSPPAAD